jgi:hypothetical protein
MSSAISWREIIDEYLENLILQLGWELIKFREGIDNLRWKK